MAECGDGDSSNLEGRTGTHETLSGPGSSMRRRKYRAHPPTWQIGAWQQLLEDP
ncbi:unnamed protein product [Staurois parvus]|uniref:Uncharacterized protein n=1 Tax=Staurois parvus TaxID=386267 RepID=A0ABN9GCU4_9NEOB|nr:unnamed protein product [Staurois parvus]